MKEQDAAHSFRENDNFKIRNYGAIQNKLLSANAELTRLRSELQQKDEVIKLLDEYISLLGKCLGESASFLDVHGWRYSQYDVEKGIELRDKIESLKSKAK